MENPERCEFSRADLVLELDLRLAAEVHAIDPVVDRVMGIVRQMRCAAGSEDAVDLALREALANAVLHGAGADPEKDVQVSVACDRTRGMLIIVRDPGAGFDPNAVPSPLVGERIYESHGRGIFLINQLMDEVTFRRGGTEIHMRKG
ncbi:MAG: ATP-binding protein [Acidobacteriota bacterium]|jgi:serine/threonine-protein kinase RsbW